ncbi:MAG: GFA family protein, partial [Rhodospirillaceae bacterium]|nr:GFA family protein [Rhodospirillaceae bacterium]
VVTWFTVAPRDFSLTRGRLSTYKSTPGAERGFCSSCGSPITFFAQTSPEDLDVTACTLDDPETIRPDRHIWTTTRLSWLHMADGLPDREGE